MIKAFALAVALMVHGVAAASCDGSGAANLVNQLDQFNSMLVNYANLGSSAIAASSTHTAENSKASFVHFDERLYENHHGVERATQGSSKAHTQPYEIKETSSAAVERTYEQTAHTSAEAKPVHHSIATSQADTKPKQQQSHQNENLLQTESSKELKVLIQDSFSQLNQQQHHLNSLAEICIPISHKLKVVSAFSRVFSTYIVHASNLKAAGKLVVKPKSKSKSKSKSISKLKIDDTGNRVEHDVSRAKRQQPGWLTMGDDVNGGYNGDINELTSTTSSTTTSTNPTAYGYPDNPYMGQPQYQTAYITVTTTNTPSFSSSPSKSKKGSADDSDTTATDDSTDSSDDESSSATVAPAAPAATKAHHGIIYSTFDGTFHLVTGTLHLIERVLHIGGGSHQSSSIANADERGGEGSHGVNNKGPSGQSTGELVSLVDKVSRLYNLNA